MYGIKEMAKDSERALSEYRERKQVLKLAESESLNSAVRAGEAHLMAVPSTLLAFEMSLKLVTHAIT